MAGLQTNGSRAARRWWSELEAGHRRAVRAWLRRNPLPALWAGSDLDWAHTEMPDPRSVVGRALLRLGA